MANKLINVIDLLNIPFMCINVMNIVPLETPPRKRMAKERFRI